MTNPNIGRVVLWMSGALVSFSVQAVAIRALARTLNIFEILSIRSGFGLVVLIGLLIARPALRGEASPRHLALHAWRNGTHFIGQYFWALSVTLLPLATVFSLEFTMPMWVAILAWPLLGERMTVARIGSVVLGFVGVMVIVRPGLTSFQPLALLVLLVAFMFALNVIATKQLTNRVSTFAVIFWMNVMQLPMALAWPSIVAATGDAPLFIFRLPSDALLPAITFGIAGLTSHYCLTNAFRWGDATTVVPLDFLRIPLIATVGWMLYQEPLDLFVFAGAGLIVCGVLWNLHAESRRTQVPAMAAGGARAAKP